MAIDARTLASLDEPPPLPAPGERWPAAEVEAALRAGLAVEPLDAERWRRLGRRLFERAVAERSNTLAAQAAECFDWLRLLVAPPPELEWERLQWTRLAAPGLRRRAVAFLLGAGDDGAFVDSFFAQRPDDLPLTARGWLEPAICRRLGDREELARRLEALRSEPPPAPPAWLTALHADLYLGRIAGALSELRRGLRRGVPQAVPAELIAALAMTDLRREVVAEAKLPQDLRERGRAAAHDADLLDGLDLLLPAVAKGDQVTERFARRVLGELDFHLSRALAATRLGSVLPDAAAACDLAHEALVQLRLAGGTVAARTCVRIEAARLLARHGDPAGVTELRAIAAPLASPVSRLAKGVPAQHLARALAELMPSHPSLRPVLERLVAGMPPGTARWLARLSLAAATDEPVAKLARGGPAHPSEPLLIALRAVARPGPSRLWRRLVPLVSLDPEAEPDRTPAAERLVRALHTDLSADDVLALARAAEAERNPRAAAILRLLTGEALAGLAHQRAAAMTERVTGQLAEAWRDALRRSQ